jgi:hypothetical protein
MNAQSEVFVDDRTGIEHPNARSLTDAFIAHFSEKVSLAVGSEVRFQPLDEDGYSFIVRGSATVGINVLEEQGILLFMSRIMKVPSSNRELFYRRLLELNYSVTADSAFSVDREEDEVFLRAARPFAGLDYEEFEQLLHNVATVADDWDDKLVAEFQEG